MVLVASNHLCGRLETPESTESNDELTDYRDRSLIQKREFGSEARL